MSEPVDISREAVERIASAMFTLGGHILRMDSASYDGERACAAGKILQALLAERDAAWKAGAEAMREAAAKDADCGCHCRPAVLGATTRMERRAACAQSECLAVAAASIRALPIPERKP
jgi:hypothetical protein